MREAANERMIERCMQRMIAAQTGLRDFGLAMHWWQRMTHYIRRRSPSQVERMERERGLRR
jgi:hypothetical protein